jgi:hypothetical protein
MAMKLSQLNREGARTHIHSHTHGHDLPPLKSGAWYCCVYCECVGVCTRSLWLRSMY